MTYEERNAFLDRAREFIGEHAEAFVLIVELEDENGESGLCHVWSGGRNRAVGMIERTRNRLDREDAEDERAPRPDDGDDWKSNA